MSSVDSLLTRLQQIQPIGSPTPATTARPVAPKVGDNKFGQLLEQTVRILSP
jgi:hypothetical protein